MKRIVTTLILAFLVIGVANAQKEEKSSKKKKKNNKTLSEKVFGKYDSNAVANSLIIDEAYVVEGEKLMKDVIVRALVNNAETAKDTTDKDGGFQFELKFDHRYILSFEKTGYVTKLVEIDLTGMPEKAKYEGYNLGRFRMTMIKYTEGMDVENYKVPVARYHYNSMTELVALDRAFLKKRKEEVELLAQANQKVIDDKAAEDADIQEEYNLLIRDADIEFEAKDYKAAKELYMEAMEIKPLAEYPRKQINIINSYLDQDLNLDEKYNALILQGNEAFKEEDYESAKLAYKSAIKLKTTEAYPREQLTKIDQIIKENSSTVAEKESKDYSLANVQIDSDTQGFSNELAKKYPQGLTIEKYMEGSKSIERRIIVDGEVGVEYKKVTHNWGGVYYFKNGKQSNHFTWQKEAIQ